MGCVMSKEIIEKDLSNEMSVALVITPSAIIENVILSLTSSLTIIFRYMREFYREMGLHLEWHTWASSLFLILFSISSDNTELILSFKTDYNEFKKNNGIEEKVQLFVQCKCQLMADSR